MTIKLLASLFVFSALFVVAPRAHAGDCKAVAKTAADLFEKASGEYDSAAEQCVPMKEWRAYVTSTAFQSCVNDKDSLSTVSDFVAAVNKACGASASK